MRVIGPAKLWPPQRGRKKGAEDIADEFIAAILLHTGRWALFLLPNNEFRYTPTRAIRFQDWCEQWPRSLVGIYDPDIDRSSLIADILAMVRH